MAALDFPNNPTLNQQFAAPNGVTYIWDGTKWTVLSGSGGGGGGGTGGTLQIAGPLTVGSTTNIPTNPRPGSLFAEEISIQADPLVAGGDRVSRFGLNLYQDNAGTGWFYLANGPGANLTVHDANVGAGPLPAANLRINVADAGTAGTNANATTDTALQLLYGQPGQPGAAFVVTGDAVPKGGHFPRRGALLTEDLAIMADPLSAGGDRVSRFGMNVFQDIGPSGWNYLGDGPGANITVHDANAGADPQPAVNVRFNVIDAGIAGTNANAMTDTGLMIFYGQPGQPGAAFVVTGNATPKGGHFPRRGALMTEDMSIMADPLVAGGDRVSRFGLNVFQDIGPSGWNYLGDGPGANITVHDPNAGADPMPFTNVRINVIEPGTAGTNANAATGYGLALVGTPGTPLNHTSLFVAANTTGTPALSQVFIGGPNTGPGGSGRALYIAN